MNIYAQVYDDNIRPLMDKIDQVRSLLSTTVDGIVFPNVVVVGDQSSGKSTLLEALSLVELPKGTGIVTRCPLVLRLRKSDKRRVYHLHDNRQYPLDEVNLNVSEYIETETRKLAGNSKNVVQDLIELQVEDPHVRDLTVVDLPGLARNPIADQPRDIYDQTKNLILKYISKEASVILCVYPANVDIAIVESFALARQVDPFGKRTIGVITKSDLAVDQKLLIHQLIMEGLNVTHLKLGFVAVRNRSTDEKISLEEARKREHDFFRQHPASTAVGWNCLGIDALINRLANLYSHRVKEIFPRMRTDIQAQIIKTNEQLSKLPPDLKTSAARLAAYNELVDLYVERILKPYLMSSNGRQRTSMINNLHDKFNKFKNTIGDQRKAIFSEEYRSNVAKEIKKCSGEQFPNFLCSTMLKQFICQKLGELWDTTDKLINECFRQTIKLLQKEEKDACTDNALLSKLINLFHHVTATYLNEKKQAVNNHLKELIELDKNDPYTVNTYYMVTVEKYKGPLAETQATTVSPKRDGFDDDDDDEFIFDAISTDDQAVKQMLISIYSYWKLLTKRFIDYTTLSLRAGCVFSVCPVVRQRLRQIPVERFDSVDKYLADDDLIQNKRKQFQKTKEILERAYAILHEDDNTADDVTDTDLIPMEDILSMTV